MWSLMKWNLQIHDVLLALGFQRNQAEYCLYIRQSDASTVMVALYVDDLLIAGSTRRAIDLVKAHLMSSFKMKDLGKVDRFLGLNICQNGVDGGEAFTS